MLGLGACPPPGAVASAPVDVAVLSCLTPVVMLVLPVLAMALAVALARGPLLVDVVIEWVGVVEEVVAGPRPLGMGQQWLPLGGAGNEWVH